MTFFNLLAIASGFLNTLQDLERLIYTIHPEEDTLNPSMAPQCPQISLNESPWLLMKTKVTQKSCSKQKKLLNDDLLKMKEHKCSADTTGRPGPLRKRSAACFSSLTST